MAAKNPLPPVSPGQKGGLAYQTNAILQPEISQKFAQNRERGRIAIAKSPTWLLLVPREYLASYRELVSLPRLPAAASHPLNTDHLLQRPQRLDKLSH